MSEWTPWPTDVEALAADMRQVAADFAAVYRPPCRALAAAEDEDGLLPIEQSLASALWTRWADPEGGPVIVIMDDPRTVARSLREWLAANTRPDTPVAAGGGVTEWGVRCSEAIGDDGEPDVTEAIDRADAERIKRHYDAADHGCEHWIVSRQVTPWTVDGPSEGDR